MRKETWGQYFGGLAFPINHAIRKAWEILKPWANENVGNVTDEVVNNDSPLPEAFYNA